jgi:hypothetical protein
MPERSAGSSLSVGLSSCVQAYRGSLQGGPLVSYHYYSRPPDFVPHRLFFSCSFFLD